MARKPNPNPNPSPITIHSFEPRTLILNLLLVLLLASPYLTHSSPSPAPSPSPSPSPLPPRTPPKHLDADHTGLRIPPPRRPPPPPPSSYRRSHQGGGVPVAPREGRRLNNGQKIGLLFTGIAIVMQVGFVGFLVFKRWQLKKMERGDRAWESSSSAPLT